MKTAKEEILHAAASYDASAQMEEDTIRSCMERAEHSRELAAEYREKARVFRKLAEEFTELTPG